MAVCHSETPLSVQNTQKINTNPDEELNCDSFEKTIHSSNSINGSIMSQDYNIKIPGDEIKVKKKVNIYTEEPNETTALRKGSEASDSLAEKSNISNGLEKCLTMTGTVKRGKKAGQNLDVKLNISREELEMLESNIAAESQKSWLRCNITTGPHVTALSLLCFPIAAIVSALYSFYMGTLMWYNIFTYISEETSIIWRVLLSPLLILFYPFFILFCTVILGFYAGFIQISWFFYSWHKEITDWEKGFYGWLSSAIRLEDCSPYEVVILTDVRDQSHTASQDTLAE